MNKSEGESNGRVIKLDPRVVAVSFSETHMTWALADGRELRIPLSWSHRLERATKEQREAVTIHTGGRYLSWPDPVDEDIDAWAFCRPDGELLDWPDGLSLDKGNTPEPPRKEG